MLALWFGSVLVGCGGAEVMEPLVPAPADEGATHSQFAVCTVSCPGSTSVSCSGTTCSGTDGQGVTCDGVFTACSASACSGLPACSQYANQSCFRSQIGTQMACCSGGGFADALLCSASSSSPTGARWLYF
ncbi:hypothetical protein SAMN05443572_109266 [Myxococcus fulvus]|uniref:Uncharacterized protein n=1 Tax=Myxococcus fulvus TaxID=33 RepID=A0A511T7N2_MYXFU|nr:hypothetical protein [Myxococcus fulvus]GEN09613.1 hypothetical protein MFU01_46500 [Myxococcus fulvus]SEU33298.1 hypothetical protein SAMN05443572_109266 [Myxococcus fulvus]